MPMMLWPKSEDVASQKAYVDHIWCQELVIGPHEGAGQKCVTCGRLALEHLFQPLWVRWPHLVLLRVWFHMVYFIILACPYSLSMGHMIYDVCI